MLWRNGQARYFAHSLLSAMGPLMEGLHAFEPKTKAVIDLESFVPDDQLLRDVDRLVAS